MYFPFITQMSSITFDDGGISADALKLAKATVDVNTKIPRLPVNNFGELHQLWHFCL